MLRQNHLQLMLLEDVEFREIHLSLQVLQQGISDARKQIPEKRDQ